MIITSLEQLYPDQSEWQELTCQMQEASTFSHLIWLTLQLGLLFARLSIQSELTRRAEQPIDWPTIAQSVAGNSARRAIVGVKCKP